AEAERKGRRPFKRGLRGDYGGVDREGDLHELGWWGTEAGKTPSPVATDPECPWVTLATSADVIKVLGRPAVLGGAWYDAMPDQCAIGCANIARHLRAVRRRLDPRLQWDEAKPVSFWRFALAMMTWSAGGRGAAHVNAYAAELATLTEDRRWARFLELAATTDDAGNRHRQDEYSALRTAQKIEAARLFAPYLRDPWWALTWGDDGLDDVARGRLYTRLVEVAKDYRE
ncbi:MAG TPA: hypothetical protein VFV33_25590, partial [Gemmatimonadaceae bacterium]|nr:hypothetical protein [Gemmatimonadaceae bacterium]